MEFHVPKVNKDSFKFSYFPRTINIWNKLPGHIVTSSSLEVFKSKLVYQYMYTISKVGVISNTPITLAWAFTTYVHSRLTRLSNLLKNGTRS